MSNSAIVRFTSNDPSTRPSIGPCPAPSWGTSLSDQDYAALQNSWITRDLADQALLRRVTSEEGSQIVGRRDNGSYSGIVYPYVWAGESHIREYSLRRDRPEFEADVHGHLRERGKYLGPPGRSSLLYLVPGTQPSLLETVSIPVAISEGAKKTISLYRLSFHGRVSGDQPRFLPVGLSGVWNWQGTIGKAPGPDGSRRNVKGSIYDLSRINWSTRVVYIIFDRNAATNTSVADARSALTRDLSKRGASVRWVTLPEIGGPCV